MKISYSFSERSSQAVRVFPSFISNSSSDGQIDSQTYTWQPPTDIYDNEENFIVKVEIAGMKGSDFMINFNQNILFINGNRNESPEKKTYKQMEIRYGEFSLAFEICSPIQTDKIEAIYDKGLLIITLPKIRTKQIEINTK